MLGTPQQRQEIATQLASKRGTEWAMGSPEYRDNAIDGVVKQQEHEAALRARSFVPKPIAQPEGVYNTNRDVNTLEDDRDPREKLREALVALAEATKERSEAGTVCDLALKRMTKCESDVAGFDGLDDKIDAWTIAQVRSGGTNAMPYALESAAKERASALERLKQATRAHTALANELRDAAQRLQERQREASVWAGRVLLQHVQERAEARERLLTTADGITAEIEAFGQSVFPNSGGLVPLTPDILRALNMSSKPRDQLTPLDLQPHREKWQQMHARLLEDPDV